MDRTRSPNPKAERKKWILTAQARTLSLDWKEHTCDGDSILKTIADATLAFQQCEGAKVTLCLQRLKKGCKRELAKVTNFISEKLAKIRTKQLNVTSLMDNRNNENDRKLPVDWRTIKPIDKSRLLTKPGSDHGWRVASGKRRERHVPPSKSCKKRQKLNENASHKEVSVDEAIDAKEDANASKHLAADVTKLQNKLTMLELFMTTNFKLLHTCMEALKGDGPAEFKHFYTELASLVEDRKSFLEKYSHSSTKILPR